MIIVLTLMVVLVVVLALYNIYSRLNSAFVLTIFGFCLIITSLVFYIMKTSYYNGMFELELKLYSMMRSINVSLNQIKVIFLFGYSVIFISQAVVFCEMSAGSRHRLHVCVASAALFLAFLTVNYPSVSERIYIMINEKFSNEKLDDANVLIKALNYLVVAYFLALPFPAIVRSIQSTEMFFKKRRNVFVLITFGVTNALILLISAFTRINSLMSPFVVTRLGTSFLNYGEYEIVLLIFAMSMILLISFAIVKFDIFDNVDFLQDIMINKKMKSLVLDLRYVLHDFKNMNMKIIALKKIADRNFGTDECKKALDKIEFTAMEYAKKMSELQSIYKQKKVKFDEVDLFERVKDAVSQMGFESTVKIYIENSPEDPKICGDPYQIQSVFYNIIKNATESIEKKGNPDGMVNIRFIEDEKWLCVEFKDNGEGFDARQMRKLWLPFSSGKSTFLNWGIGLNQARKIMSAHLGHIDVKSKKDKYAVIQTAFLRNL